MKKYIFLFLVAAVFISCKSKKNNTTGDGTGKTVGIVSHEQKKSGCSAIIKVEGEDALILIPKDELGSFDVDGLKITFNYHVLKMPNREGCSGGMMAEITDISKL